MSLPDAPAVLGRASYTGWVRDAILATADRPDAISLFNSTVDEPTDLLAEVVRRAFKDRVTDRYESVFARGNPFMIRAVAARYGVGAEQVIGATGAIGAMAMAIRAFVDRGRHVIVETPCVDFLPIFAREAGASVSYLPRRAPDFAADPAELASLVRPDTQLIVLTQLHNPTGASLDADAVRALGEVAGRAGATLLLDEVYGDFAADGPVGASLSPHVVSVGSLSKVQGLYALKCGWIIVPPGKLARMLAANAQLDPGVSKLSHAIGALVLEDMAPFDAYWREVLARTRPVLERHVGAMVAEGLLAGALPGRGCMYFPQVCGVADTRALSDWLWAEHRLVMAPGEFFGAPGRLRIGFGGDAGELDRGLQRLYRALGTYRGL